MLMIRSYVFGIVAICGFLAFSVAQAQESPDEATPVAEPPVAEPPAAEPPVAEPPAAGRSPASDEPAPERKLRFGFRRTRWIDVLDWLADESGLSLQLEAPPPGSFDYSDPKEYTPIEAIDVVNSRLAMIGYTLVRRERMLVLIDIRNGVPRALLPEVKLDELDQRGEFEWVSVKFPIEGRKMEAVVAEIQVLLGPYGAVTPLPGSGQVLVSDRASVMRTIDAVVKKIPKPPGPKPKPKPKDPPPPPELRVYMLTGADPTAVLDTLKALFGSAKAVHDPGSDAINVFTTPGQHAAIEKIFKQIQGGGPDGNRPRLETYPLPDLEDAARQSFLENLVLVAPSATQRFDEDAGRLFIWAKPIEHDAIRSAIVKLLQVAPLSEARELVVYSLVRTDPTTLGTLLETTLPRVKISIDTAGRRLIVLASAEEHALARQLVDQIDAEPPVDRRPTLRIYPIDRHAADHVSALILRFAPEAEVTVDSKLGRASVVATAADHARIEPLLEKITEAAADLPSPTVETFKVPKELRERFVFIRTLIDAEVPDAKILWNAESGELTVWATAEDHLRVGTFLDQMGRQPPVPLPKNTVEVIKVPKELRDRFEAVQSLLTAELTDAKLTWNPATLELTVWATAKEHARVQEVLEQVKKQPAPDLRKPTFEVHKLPKALRDRFESIQALLTAEVPDAKMTWDPKSLELTVWAMADDHARVREVLDQIEKQPIAEPSSPTVEVHALPDELRGRFESVRTLFDTEVPDAKMLWNAEDGELTVWAIEADHLRVREFLDQVSRQPPEKKTHQLVVYPLDMRDMSTVVTALQNVVKDAQITADNEGRRILVWATTKDHVAIEKAVKDLGGGDATGGRQSFMSHPIKGLELELASRLLTEQFPGMTFEQDSRRSALITRATSKEHQQIAAAIQAMQAVPPGAENHRTVVYATDPASSEAVANVLTDMLPGAHVVGQGNVPNVSVRGTDAEHELAKAVVDQWNKNRRELDRPIAKVYTLKSAEAENVRLQLYRLVRDAYFAVGSSPGQLLARASAEEHVLIAELIAQIDQPTEDETKVVAVYDLPSGDLTSLTSLLDEKTASEIQTVSGGRDRVIIRATPEIHEKLKVVIDQLSPVVAPKPHVANYPIKHVDLTPLAAFLRGSAPGTQIYADTAKRRLLIWGTDDDHERLADLIEKIDIPDEDESKVVAIYELSGGDLSSVTGFLDERTRGKIHSVSGGRDRVIVRATPDIHKRLKAVISQVSPLIDPEPHMVIYKVKHIDPTSLVSLIGSSVPGAQITPNTNKRQLLIWGTDDDHELLTKLIEQIDTPDQDDSMVVAVYELPGGSLSSVTSFLDARTATEIQSISGGRDRVIVRATPENHKKIQAVIDQVRPVIEPELRIAIYHLHQADPLIVTKMIQSVAPQAEVTEDTKRRRLLVRGTAEDHKVISKTIQEMGGDEAGPDERSFLSHPVKRLDLAMALRLLESRFPGVSFEQDAERVALVALATAEEHKQIGQTIQEMQTSPKEDVARRVVIYPTDPASSAPVADVLSDLLPNARVVSARYVPNVSVRGTDEEHALAQKVVEQWNRNRRERDARSPEVYTLKTLSAADIRRELYRLVPTAYFAVGPTSNQVLARATIEEHALIARLIEQIDQQSEADAKVLAVYELPGGDLSSLTDLLDDRIAEEIESTPGGRDRAIVRATPENHKRLQALIDQVRPVIDPELQITIYHLRQADPLIVSKLIETVAPEAEVTEDTKRRRLLIRGTEDDHLAISKVIHDLGGDEAGSDERSFLSHRAGGLDMAMAMRLLEDRFPDVSFEEDSRRSAVVALATAEEHEQIGKILEQIQAAPKEDVARRVVVYPTDRMSSASVGEVLTNLLPNAHVVGTRYVPNVSVRGTDEEHVLAKTVVDQWNKNRKELDQPTAKVYELKSVSASEISTELARLVESAYFAVGPTPRQLLARASEEEHELIARLLEQIDTPSAADNKVVAVYELPGGDVTSLQGLLDDRMTDEIKAVPGGRDRVIIRATPDLHTKIKAVVEQVTPALGGKPLVEVYRFERAAAIEGARVVRQIAPDAQIVIQPESQSLAVSAVTADHERIAEAVAQIERSAEKSDAELVSVVPVLEADPENLVTLLQTKYTDEPEWNFSYDAQTRSILVIGPGRRHDEIKTIIAAADAAKSGHDEEVAVYPLGRINGFIARQLVTELIAKEPDPGTITLEPNGNQLVVVADRRQQDIIRQALQQLKPKETQFEVYTLEVLDPETADNAIFELFSSSAEGGTPPIVDADPANYRIYVRGTTDQLSKIRELLTKMGETTLDGPSDQVPKSKIRFIPLGGDAESAIDAIRNVWPRLRKNELRVLGPDSSRLRGGQGAGFRGQGTGDSGQWAVGSGQEADAPPQADDSSSLRPVEKASDPDASSAGARTDRGAGTADKDAPPPVFIIPGDRGVTLMSEDADALEQLERLLTIVVKPQPRGGRRLTVYSMKNADATRLARELNRFYRSIPSYSRGRTGAVAFAADERLNAVVVFATRADQREIEELLDILDSELSPDIQAMNQPVVIPLMHARAETVERQLRALYQTQLTAGGKQPAMEIPSGANPIVAAMMQQINAVRQGPLMTIEIDEDTNSLLVIAPPSLIKEVQAFAEDLDQAADEHPRRAIKIVPLREINAEEMDRALERVFRGSGRSRRRR